MSHPPQKRDSFLHEYLRESAGSAQAHGKWGECDIEGGVINVLSVARPRGSRSTTFTDSVARGFVRALADLAEQAAGPSVESRLESLELRVNQLERKGFVVPMTSLEPDPFDLINEMPITIQICEDNATATFFDANLGITGDTPEEAFSNLRSLIVDVYEELEADEGRLGPETERQLAVLRTYIRSRS